METRFSTALSEYASNEKGFSPSLILILGVCYKWAHFGKNKKFRFK